MLEELLIHSFFDLEGFPWKELFEGAVYPWEALARLDAFCKTVEGNIEVEIPPGVHLVHPEQIAIGQGTLVEPGAMIVGPCLIGPNCQIRQGAYIRGNVVAGPGAVIGHDTEVKHAILLNGAAAAHFNYVGNSILGRNANLGAGVKCANLRLDHKEIIVYVRGQKIATGLKKLGAIVGDGAQLGCNAVTNPGTLIGKGAICYPCLNIGGVIPPYTKVASHDNASSH